MRGVAKLNRAIQFSSRGDAAKALQALTGAGRTVCYTALKLDGRFGKQLRANRGLLTWRA